MDVPAHFATDEAVVHHLLGGGGLADLITVTDVGLPTTRLPFATPPPANTADPPETVVNRRVTSTLKSSGLE
jgi:hypothetical protein